MFYNFNCCVLYWHRQFPMRMELWFTNSPKIIDYIEIMPRNIWFIKSNIDYVRLYGLLLTMVWTRLLKDNFSMPNERNLIVLFSLTVYISYQLMLCYDVYRIRCWFKFGRKLIIALCNVFKKNCSNMSILVFKWTTYDVKILFVTSRTFNEWCHRSIFKWQHQVFSIEYLITCIMMEKNSNIHIHVSFDMWHKTYFLNQV